MCFALFRTECYWYFFLLLSHRYSLFSVCMVAGGQRAQSQDIKSICFCTCILTKWEKKPQEKSVLYNSVLSCLLFFCLWFAVFGRVKQFTFGDEPFCSPSAHQSTFGTLLWSHQALGLEPPWLKSVQIALPPDQSDAPIRTSSHR